MSNIFILDQNKEIVDQTGEIIKSGEEKQQVEPPWITDEELLDKVMDVVEEFIIPRWEQMGYGEEGIVNVHEELSRENVEKMIKDTIKFTMQDETSQTVSQLLQVFRDPSKKYKDYKETEEETKKEKE